MRSLPGHERHECGNLETSRNIVPGYSIPIAQSGLDAEKAIQVPQKQSMTIDGSDDRRLLCFVRVATKVCIRHEQNLRRSPQ